MIRCPNCKNKFKHKHRIKALFDKNKILKCDKCNSKYVESEFAVKLSFYFSAIIYIIFNSKIFIILGNWIYSDFLKEILKIILGIIWIIGCVYMSQFFSKFKKIN